MKAFVLDRPGDTETLRLADLPLPRPGKGEVLVKMAAVGLNPVDYKSAQRGHPAWQYPHVLGLDIAGTVEELGEGVTTFRRGDRVYGHGNLSRSQGGYAEYALADARALAIVPMAVSAVEAAALPTAALTAYQAFFRKFHIEAGQTVLIHGGSGGVGGFAIQFAKQLGLHVLSTASPRNAAKVEALGAAHVIDYQKDVPAEVLRLTAQRGTDLVLDTVGKDSATEAFRYLAFGGQIACIVALPDFAAWRPFEKSPSVHELALGGAHLSGDDHAICDLGRMAHEVITQVAAKKLDPMVGEIVDFPALPAALGRLKRREVAAGKVVVRIAEGF